jgi:hypothetical protein
MTRSENADRRLFWYQKNQYDVTVMQPPQGAAGRSDKHYQQ